MKELTSYRTLKKNTIKYMLDYVQEYESVLSQTHPEFKYARDFFQAKKICFQNFYKFYGRYKASGDHPEALLPTRRGLMPKYQEMPLVDGSLEAQILAYRQQGYDRYVIAAALKREGTSKI